MNILPFLGPVIDRLTGLIPDPAARAKAREAIEQDLVTAANAALQGQLEINKVEAAHKSLFVAGWRPFIGWACGVGLAWAFVVAPLLASTLAAFGVSAELPAIETENLMELVMGMLGLAGLRTFEKFKDVSREN
tara:strand:+ start:661 stop:1062 length:402 start_codon:yes stop_codon:yes gene_type:complete